MNIDIVINNKNNKINSNDISNSISNSNNDIVLKKNKPTKKEYYKQERDLLICELNKIIGIDSDNYKIFLYEIENNENIDKYLSDNIDKIRKFYKTGKWSYFSNDILKGKDNWIGLLRSLYSDSNYEIISKQKTNTFNGVKKQYTEWNFRKLNI